MFELTNNQRECFALVPVSQHWECIEAKAGPYDQFKTYLYIENETIVKCILVGDSQYWEYELSERVSPDRKYLLPKTAKGKPVILSSSTIQKRNGVGMSLYYHNNNIHLHNDITNCFYYSNCYSDNDINTLNDFARWVEKWCNETTPADQADILRFLQQKRKRIRYKEGDVFRFKIGRRLYGYGRILLDYDKMRKNKEAFWNILMSKPLVCSVYHIATERDDVTVDELKNLQSLPSTIITDNSLFYGEYEIIGNIPIAEHEDYPIMYGGSLDYREKAVCYQCGKVYRKMENGEALYAGFINNMVAFKLNFTLEVLLQCIKENTNEPYWTNYHPFRVDSDLCNPKYSDKLKK